VDVLARKLSNSLSSKYAGSTKVAWLSDDILRYQLLGGDAVRSSADSLSVCDVHIPEMQRYLTILFFARVSEQLCTLICM
jgi:hypothetical protein